MDHRRIEDKALRIQTQCPDIKEVEDYRAEFPINLNKKKALQMESFF